MKHLLISFIFLICTCLPARGADFQFDPWEASWQVLNVIEWSLTDKIIHQGGEEIGLARLAFGPHPSTKDCILGGAVTGVIHLGLNWYITTHNPEYLYFFRRFGTVVKVGVVGYELTVVEW